MGQFQVDARARQAMLFQRPYMLRASVLHNVALGLWLGSVPWKLAKSQALQALERVGLADLAGRHARALSGAQHVGPLEQHRLACARVHLELSHVWLDEPVQGAQQGALAAAIGAHQRHTLAAGYPQRHSAQSDQAASRAQVHIDLAQIKAGGGLRVQSRPGSHRG
jgi:ABC-type taurine transport system ATPase subunit